MFGLFRSKPTLTRLANITVYYLSSIDEQGNAKASPLGKIPRLTDEQEGVIQRTHQPQGTSYLNDTLNGVTAILYWNGPGVEAVSFLSAQDAHTACPGLVEFSLESLRQLDPFLTHFPR